MAMTDRRIGGAARRSRKRLGLGLIEVASRMRLPWRMLDELERGRLRWTHGLASRFIRALQ